MGFLGRLVATTAFVTTSLLPAVSGAQGNPAGVAPPGPGRPLFPVLPHGDATPGMPRNPFWQGVNDANEALRPIVVGPVPIILERINPPPPPPTTFQALTTTPQNWDTATGELMYSYQAIDIPAGAPRNAQQMYGEMTDFRHFNPNGRQNIATAALVTAPPGTVGPNANRQFVMFRADPDTSVVGILNGAQQAINSEWVPVEIFRDEQNMTITAVTMGDHMIVGVRRWTVKPNPDGSYRIETEAWEQRNGMANDVAMRTGVPLILSGKDVMGMVWENYLTNLASRANNGRFTWAPGTNGPAGLWRHRPNLSPNPFRPGIPGSGVPGQLPPPGFFGPSFGPGDPHQPRQIFHPDEWQMNTALLIIDTDRRLGNARTITGQGINGFNGDLARIRRTAPWYRQPEQAAQAAAVRGIVTAVRLQNEFIESDLNQRVALPLRRAAEDTYTTVRDDVIATPLNQNLLLARRVLTGNRLDWLFGGPGPAPAAPVPANNGWNGRRLQPTNGAQGGGNGNNNNAPGAGAAGIRR